jgi:polyphosphate kinase 2 (PPK2 family)
MPSSKPPNALRELARELVRRHTVREGGAFRLDKCDPADTGPFDDGERAAAKESTKAQLAEGVKILAEMQDKLYAQDRWSLLLVFQAMDAAGKDGVIKHVMSGINPQGCEVHSFKAPSAEELDHDFLWRCSRLAPRRGMIGIFNRSYYEEVLVVRVHPEHLKRQQLPDELVTADIWTERFQDIRKFERYLARQGTIIRKFFLHVSRKSSGSASSSGSTTPRRTGSSAPAMSPSARAGTNTCAATRRRSARPPPSTRRGSWFPPTTSGTRGLWSRRRSARRSRRSTCTTP